MVIVTKYVLKEMITKFYVPEVKSRSWNCIEMYMCMYNPVSHPFCEYYHQRFDIKVSLIPSVQVFPFGW